MPTARSSPHAATASWWNSAPPASRKPPLRPAAPPATGPASTPTTLAPAASAEPTAASPEPPRPMTQTSAETSPRNGAGFSAPAGSPQTGVCAGAGMARDAIHGLMPIEPAPCAWAFPPAAAAGPDDVVAVGADLAPGTLLAAYRAGLFPMPVDGAPAMVWWSPQPRGILPLEGFHVSRSLRRTH